MKIVDKIGIVAYFIIFLTYVMPVGNGEIQGFAYGQVVFQSLYFILCSFFLFRVKSNNKISLLGCKHCYAYRALALLDDRGEHRFVSLRQDEHRERGW